jgi:chaperone required for assembly of F1-ATPase
VKRFYQDVTVSLASPLEGQGAGYAILLDSRPVRTPAKAPLTLPALALAEAIAGEWRAQSETLAPATMALTKLANTALDRVAPRRAAAVAQVMAFVNDLICYRAPHPASLVARQSAEWDPLLDWAATRYHARLETGIGPVPFDQSAEAVAALRYAVEAFDAFALTALATVAPILGSLVLTLALAESRLDANEAFALSQLDERYQAEHWGHDEAAAARAANLLAEIETTATFLRLSSPATSA